MKFWEPKKAQDFFKAALDVMNTEKIPFLRISDYNTTGLCGSDGEYNTPWCNLTKSSGASDKAGTSGGSFGIGKYAPFACSSFRTVFYSTLDKDGKSAYQGISRITSFRNDNNEITSGVGYCGGENNSPVFNQQLVLDPAYSRPKGKTGTDVYIAGFRKSIDWKSDIVASILDGFLYAIYTGKLVVHVDDSLSLLMRLRQPDINWRIWCMIADTMAFLQFLVMTDFLQLTMSGMNICSSRLSRIMIWDLDCLNRR